MGCSASQDLVAVTRFSISVSTSLQLLWIPPPLFPRPRGLVSTAASSSYATPCPGYLLLVCQASCCRCQFWEDLPSTSGLSQLLLSVDSLYTFYFLCKSPCWVTVWWPISLSSLLSGHKLHRGRNVIWAASALCPGRSALSLRLGRCSVNAVWTNECVVLPSRVKVWRIFNHHNPVIIRFIHLPH